MALKRQVLQDYPFVSVVMPVRNEALTIARSVGAILRQNYPSSRIEIIVADGLSDDGTVELITQFPGSERIKIILNHKRIQSAGMNRAIEVARGEIIIRVDGHTIIGADYVCHCVEMLINTDAVNVGGSIHPASHSALGQAIAAASKSLFAIPSTFRIGTKSQYVDTVYMGAWWRSTFDRVGKFDEEFAVNEDYELNYRIRAAGERILYLPDLCSEYYGPDTLQGLARQHFRYGRSKPKTIDKHPASARFRHFAAPALVAFTILGGLLALRFREVAFIWVGGLSIYLLGVIGFAFQAAGRKSCGSLGALLSVFPVIHIAWGCGFWYGMVQLLIAHVRNIRLSLP